MKSNDADTGNHPKAWSVDVADRLAVLVDAEPYYTQLDRCFREARSSIYINGWDLDTGISLTPMTTNQTIADLVEELLANNPDLHIYILLWHLIAIQSNNRGLPPFRQSWSEHPRIHFRYDLARPVESARHEKIVVVDRRIAFMGNTDISRERWDVYGHGPDAAPYRINGDGERYQPHHDLQAMMTGPAAVRLAEYFEAGWNGAVEDDDVTAASDQFPPAHEVVAATTPAASPRRLSADTGSSMAGHDLWPAGIAPQYENVALHFSRTAPAFADRPGVREIENTLRHVIAQARSLVFIEMQYLTASAVADALLARLREREPPCIVIILPRHTATMIERLVMGPLQARQLERLIGADHARRLRVYYPALPVEGEELMLHSKLTIVDDDILHFGSANFNERSMRVDNELDFTLYAEDDAQQAAIRALRHELLAEHTGMERTAFEPLRDPVELLSLLDAQRDNARALKTYPVEEERANDTGLVDGEFSDPKGLYATRELKLMNLSRTGVKKRLVGYSLLAVLGCVAMVLLWTQTPAEQWLKDYLLAMGESRSLLSVLTVSLVLVLASLVMMPITLITVVCFVLLGPWWGLFSSMLVSIASAALAYAGGRWLDARWLGRVTGPRLERLTERLQNASNGITLVVIARLLPVAPFTAVNLAMGAGRVRFLHFMVGSFLGLLPSKVVLALFADQTLRFMTHPTLPGIAVFALLAVSTTGLVYAATRWLENRSPISD